MTRLHRTGAIALCACALALAGCDSTTGPADQPVDVTGSWTYAATNMSGTLSGGVGISCRFSNVPMSITQSGATFTGTTQGGNFSCSALGETDGGTFGSRIVVNGRISGTSVEYDFDSPDWHHTGSIEGNSMSGSATAIFDVGSGTVVLRGNWSATR